VERLFFTLPDPEVGVGKKLFFTCPNLKNGKKPKGFQVNNTEFSHPNPNPE